MELLLAVAISLVVITAALFLFTSVSGRTARNDLLTNRTDASIALGIIERDINCAVSCYGVSTQEVFVLTGQDDGKLQELQFKFFTAAPAEGESDLRFYDIIEVYYSLEPEEKGTFVLNRSSRPARRDEQDFSRETLLRGLSDFKVQVFDGTSWTNECLAVSTEPMPSAAAINLYWPGDAPPARLFSLIPAGLNFEPQNKHDAP